MKITVVYNKKSGSAKSTQELRALFKKHGMTIEKMVAIGKGFENELGHVIKNGGYVAAIGGDGTVSAVAGLVAGTNATLVPLPGGTLNHFTKDLGVDQDLDQAIANASKAKVRSIDIASVNDTYFINNSSIGLYPRSLMSRSSLEGNIGKWPAATLSTIKELFQYRTYTITIGKETFSTPFIFVGNNDYKLEDLVDTSRDKLDAGILSVYIVKSGRRLELLKIVTAALFKKLDSLDSFDLRKTATVTIATRKTRRVHVSYDGEYSRLETPLTYKVNKGALRVIA